MPSRQLASNKNFQKHVTVFLRSWMPKQRSRSANTVAAYRDSISLFLVYMRDERGISANKMTLHDLTAEAVGDFLLWLEDERENSTATRNARLAALRSFADYLQYEEPEMLTECRGILSIHTKKGSEGHLKYLSSEAVKAILEEAAEGSLRDLALLQLLYDSGCRVGELINLSTNSLALRNPSENSTVYLVGKGRKSRIVGISALTTSHLREYLKRRDKSYVPSDPLFTNQKGERLTRGGVAYILSKYVDTARNEHPELFPSWHITPHTMRHSRATHWLAEGVPLEKIRDLLGHEFISTTEIYAQVLDKDKQEAIERANAKVLAKAHYEPPAEEDFIEFLKTVV